MPEIPRDTQIDLFLEMLRICWKLNPHLRLGQLIDNAANQTKCDVFYIDDKKLIDAVKDFTQQKLFPQDSLTLVSPSAGEHDQQEHEP